MNTEKFLPLAKGLIKKIFKKALFDSSTGGTCNSRYCYSVWMRHLNFAYHNGMTTFPKTIAELGPGDSLGIGLTALLTGSEHYYAMDVHKYWNPETNVRIFDELVEMLRRKEPIPNNQEFPRVTPSLNNYSFPENILSSEHMQKCLTTERINAIRKELSTICQPDNNSFVRYFIPWNDERIIESNSVDLIFSQAVLQYVDDLDITYAAMHKWLKTGGFMSHSIDFTSHGITRTWNGHWLFSANEWKIVHGNNKIILNRVPLSVHLNLLKKYHFALLHKLDYIKPTKFSTSHFNEKFKDLNSIDIETQFSVILSKKS